MKANALWMVRTLMALEAFLLITSGPAAQFALLTPTMAVPSTASHRLFIGSSVWAPMLLENRTQVTIVGIFISSSETNPPCGEVPQPSCNVQITVYRLNASNSTNYQLLFASDYSLPNWLKNGTYVMVNGTLLTPSSWQTDFWMPVIRFNGDLQVNTISPAVFSVTTDDQNTSGAGSSMESGYPMVTPIALFLTLMGGLFYFVILQKRRPSSSGPAAFLDCSYKAVIPPRS